MESNELKLERYLGENASRIAQVLLPLSMLIYGLFATSSASAQVSGQINVTVTLVAGCAVESSSATSNVDFGDLDFGSQPTLFSQADAQVVGVNGNGISIQCSTGLSPTLQIVNGANDANAGSNTHALTDGSNYIPYDVYDDAAYSAGDILNNTDTIAITADGTLQTVNLYGRAVGASGLDAGSYTDTLTMLVDF